MPRNGGYRIAMANVNVPNMVGQISTAMAKAGLNIIDLLNKSRGNLAFTLADVESEIPDSVVQEITKIEGILSVHTL